MREQIGKVTLDYSKYPGKDYYSEGISEDALLEVVEKYDESEFDHVILNTRSWPMLYHLSNVRTNIVSWLPITNTQKVLEIGAGCGAITCALSDMAGSVTCIELSKKRSTINATRNRHRKNIEILVGNFEDIEPELTEKYDFITLIGVFEYAESYINTVNPYETFLERIGKHLTPDGKIVIAIENQFGLKYFAGCKEDHTGRLYEGIEGYPASSGVKTFSKKHLEEIIASAGYQSEFYYPYPDYKLPHTIYSDAHLPGEGDLTTNIRNYDADRVIAFDESKAFDQIIREGMFPYYSNSYLVLVSKEKSVQSEKTIYSKYSSERKDELSIRTYITETPAGERHVYKAALGPKANAHIMNMSNRYETFETCYEHSKLKPNKCLALLRDNETQLIAGKPTTARARIELEYLEGMVFEKYLDTLQDQREYDKMRTLILQYGEEVEKTACKLEFEPSAKLEQVFGKCSLPSGGAAANPCNFDLIFSNIVLIGKDEEHMTWNVLDYEWTFDFLIPIQFMIYRALFYYLESEKTKPFKTYLNEQGIDLYASFGITDHNKAIYAKMEHQFQLYIIGEKASLTLLKAIMPAATVSLPKLVESATYLRNLQTPKVYYSAGEGFEGSNQIMTLAQVDEEAEVSVEIPLENRMRSIRIDPTEYPCVIQVKSIKLETEEGIQEIDRYLVNGLMISDNTIVYNTDDAQIVLNHLPRKAKSLHVEYAVTMFKQSFFDQIVKQLEHQRELVRRKQASFKERAMVKVRLKKREMIPEGYCYNKESEE
ncbi:MAG: class I SAM-dependent methyltransferase [bacterium]|nr:class I SAM-dependent methyltransferase [bacterium]